MIFFKDVFIQALKDSRGVLEYNVTSPAPPPLAGRNVEHLALLCVDFCVLLKLLQLHCHRSLVIFMFVEYV